MITTINTGDTRVLRNRVKLDGGVFDGWLETTRQIPDCHVVSIAVQEFREGNGAQRIQRSSYVCAAGKGVAL